MASTSAMAPQGCGAWARWVQCFAVARFCRAVRFDSVAQTSAVTCAR
jgi:hypothetical protein